MGLFGGLIGLASSALSYSGSKKDSKAAKNAANMNALISWQNAVRDNQRAAEVRRQADEVRQQGGEDAGKIAQAGDRLQSKQRAAMGASGVVVDSGTFQDITQDTADASREDQQTALLNAYREAYGYELKAQDYNLKAADETFEGLQLVQNAKKASKQSGIGALGSLIAGTYSSGASAGWW